MENREIALSSVHLDPAEVVDRCKPPTPPRSIRYEGTARLAERRTAQAQPAFILSVSAKPPRGEATQRADFAASLVVLVETPGG